MGLKWPLLALFIPLASASAFAQSLALDLEGECSEYAATLTAAGFEKGCYDVKIDIAQAKAEVLDPREG